MWINKFGILAINQKSPKDITEGILFRNKLAGDKTRNTNLGHSYTQKWDK